MLNKINKKIKKELDKFGFEYKEVSMSGLEFHLEKINNYVSNKNYKLIEIKRRSVIMFDEKDIVIYKLMPRGVYKANEAWRNYNCFTTEVIATLKGWPYRTDKTIQRAQKAVKDRAKKAWVTDKIIEKKFEGIIAGFKLKILHRNKMVKISNPEAEVRTEVRVRYLDKFGDLRSELVELDWENKKIKSDTEFVNEEFIIDEIAKSLGN